MKKTIIIFFFLITSSFASYEIIDAKNIYTVKIENTSFQNKFVNLKDEIIHNSFIIVHEINLANSTNNIANVLKKKEVLVNGKTLLICKGSFALQMLEENISNITYCPLAISTYEKNETVFISFRKYKSFNKEDKIANKINTQLKKLILDSLKD